MAADEAKLERAALAMMDRYGEGALNMAVRAARKYMEDGNVASVRDWVAVGQKIKEYRDDPARRVAVSAAAGE
ncbi:MAG: hypothetical protein ABW189_03575 [Rickettsiales bacterium]